MTIVDRRLECESCHFRFDDFSLLRLHKKQNEGVCDSYDVTSEEQYYRRQNFQYKSSPELPDPPKMSPKMVNPPLQKEAQVNDCSPAKEVAAEKDVNEVKICINEVKICIKMKTISPVLKCSFCSVEFNIDQDKHASFKLVDHVATQHPLQNFKFRSKFNYF